MAYENLVPGTYKARVVDWTLQEVEAVNQLKAVIKFSFEANGTYHTMNWDGFFVKKDGAVNEKTVKSLKACGFNKKSVAGLLDPDALDTQKDVFVTVAKDGQYWRVEWVNDGSMELKKPDVKKVKGYDLRKVDSVLALAFTAEKKVPNMAPGAEEEMPF
jgi:hypothetical protein